jgi:pimeloyl-ACP methyl ester carboxylesterase
VDGNGNVRTCVNPVRAEGWRIVRTPRLLLFVLLGLTGVDGAMAASSDVPSAVQVSKWNGFDRVDFMIEGRAAILVGPATAAPGRPWIWRMEFFGHQPQVDLALLARGWHVAYIDAKNLYGGPRAMRILGQFYAHVVVNYQFSKRVVLEGFSRGGLYAFNFAATHPSRVAALYLDAPVLDIRSWPGNKRDSKEWAECLEAYGLSEESLAGFRGNPLDRIVPVAKGGIPIIVVAGEADTVVPMAENTAILERRFREAGGTIEVIRKPGVDHHPHSLEDPTPVVEFLLRHAKF